MHSGYCDLEFFQGENIFLYIYPTATDNRQIGNNFSLTKEKCRREEGKGKQILNKQPLGEIVDLVTQKKWRLGSQILVIV